MATSATAEECYTSSILSPTPFMGNDGEIFKLADGSIWKVKFEYEYLYEYYPNVIICPSRGTLVINNTKLNVEQLAAGKLIKPKSGSRTARVIESQIDGDFKGWEGETVVKLMNGEIWQQSEYYYEYYYAFMPNILIFPSSGGYQMKVEGIEKSVGVTQLR